MQHTMMNITQALIGLNGSDNPHSNSSWTPFFDRDARVERCTNEYCFDDGHTNKYLWVTEHHCDKRLGKCLREWLENLFYRPSDTIPILGTPLQATANEIRNKLIEDCFCLNGFDKVQVAVRAGHLYSLYQQVDGSIEISSEDREFSQQWPLFADVTIYAQEATHPSNTCQVLITVEKFGSGGPYVLLEAIAKTPRQHFSGVGGITVA